MCANRSAVCTGSAHVTIYRRTGQAHVCRACADLLASKGLIRRELADAATA